jgi:hypothetical protein
MALAPAGLSLAQSVSTIDEHEAFLAMSEFLWLYAQRAGDDLITLVGDTELEADGNPTDPAAWDDWLACVRDVKAGVPLRQRQDL